MNLNLPVAEQCPCPFDCMPAGLDRRIVNMKSVLSRIHDARGKASGQLWSNLFLRRRAQVYEHMERLGVTSRYALEAVLLEMFGVKADVEIYETSSRADVMVVLEHVRRVREPEPVEPTAPLRIQLAPAVEVFRGVAEGAIAHLDALERDMQNRPQVPGWTDEQVRDTIAKVREQITGGKR